MAIVGLSFRGKRRPWVVSKLRPLLQTQDGENSTRPPTWRLVSGSISWQPTIRVFFTKEPGQFSNQSPSGNRKSTRLNSSHQIISYAVFCLKKKKVQTNATPQPPPTQLHCSPHPP